MTETTLTDRTWRLDSRAARPAANDTNVSVEASRGNRCRVDELDIDSLPHSNALSLFSGIGTAR